jgi:glycosyltransferase involved in cell wall biosynthesis
MIHSYDDIQTKDVAKRSICKSLWSICGRFAFLIATLFVFGNGLFFRLNADNIAAQPVEFVIVVASYNNEKWVEKNLQSCLLQTYPFWSCVYVNDNSSDKTGDKVEQFVQSHGLEQRFRIIHTNERGCPLKSHSTAIQMCDPKKVIVCLDGDDWFANDRVLEVVAKAYEDPKVWLTYGNYKSTDTSSLKSCCETLPKRVLKRALFRSHRWVTSHLKTFYAALFQKINKDDLYYKDQFYPMAGDMAMMMPMLEMASQGHIRFIPEVLYIYNVHNPLNEDKIDIGLQMAIDTQVRSQKKYKPLTNLFGP